MEKPFSSFYIVDKFLAATDELLDFTRPTKDREGVETEELVKVLKKHCPNQWYTEQALIDGWNIDEDDDE